jgi:hypothetical protein
MRAKTIRKKNIFSFANLNSFNNTGYLVIVFLLVDIKSTIMISSIFSQKNKSKKSLNEIVTDYLAQKKFNYETFQDGNSFIVPLSGDNGNWKLGIFIDAEREILQLRSFCPIKIKENQKLKISELISRINYDCYLGCFIMDFEECEITFKTIHLGFENELTNSAFNILFNTNAQTLDEHLPIISAVNSGFSEPFLL